MRTDTPQPIHLSDYRAPDFLVDEVHLDVDLAPNTTRVKARLAVRRNGDHDRPLTFNGERLKLVSAAIDGRALGPADYELDDEFLTIAAPGAAFSLETEVEIDPEGNKALEGLYMSAGRFCTQCEAEGFRKITYFPDRPDVLARFTVRIEGEQTFPHLLSNGNLIESGELAGGRHYAVWNDPFPKPCYLFALVAGELDVLEDKLVTMTGRTVDLRIYVDPGMAPRASYAMDALKRSMTWDEQTFGLEYDLDLFMIVAVRDFNFGAMENKGLNIFNSSLLLADQETATDYDYERIESVIAHEYFHNWTGDRITCRDWFQLCLKEGLTVFRDQEFSSDMRSRAVKRISDVRGLRATQFVEDAGPLAHPVRPETYKEINNFYTTTVYEKGAEVVRMVKTLIGAEKFRAGMDLYFKRHDGHAATVEQFIQCFADASGRDMTQFMRWYSQAGTPELTVSTRFDSTRKIYTLDCRQSIPPTPGQATKEPMVIPLGVGLLGSDGADLPLSLAKGGTIDHGVLVLSEPAATFEFSGISERPVLSINRGFSAPIKVESDLTGDDLVFLAAHDSDAFNRWQALQTASMRLLIENVSLLRAGKLPRDDDKLIAAIAAIVDDTTLEPAFVALALVPPGEGDVAHQIGRDIDPDAIHNAREALRAAIGQQIGKALARTYERMTIPGAYSPDAKSAGRRALRNIALDLLAVTGAPDGIARAMRQYEAADNMTDRMAALAALAFYGGSERERALPDFYRRYAGEALVIDKWFSLQAMSPQSGTLATVHALTTHPDFSINNPNRVRALIGAFAQANPTQFNKADGSGYDFVAECILEIDGKNPQVAARLATAFRSWRTMDAPRRKAAEAALSRIKAAPALSRDVADIVERALAAA
ncbi:MAG TPA: aminopeptidase N [Pseudolabrys sp.]|nr:aminopeptidase N [Pseudolabrys sp.]